MNLSQRMQYEVKKINGANNEISRAVAKEIEKWQSLVEELEKEFEEQDELVAELKNKLSYMEGELLMKSGEEY